MVPHADGKPSDERIEHICTRFLSFNKYEQGHNIDSSEQQALSNLFISNSEKYGSQEVLLILFNFILASLSHVMLGHKHKIYLQHDVQ